MAQKKKLLGTFLKLGGDLKGKKDLWHKELLTYSKRGGLLAAIILPSKLCVKTLW